MRVLVTGGTGFVGSHTVAALVRAGHRVRVLARDPARAPAALGPLGVRDVEVVAGDVLDPESVERAGADCDAAIHGASVYTLDSRQNATVRRTNVRGTEIVLGIAVRQGLDPVIHVSSIAALLGPRGATLTADSPPTHPPGAYFRSKADSDRVARRLQTEGAPVVITYPAMVWGPHDPRFGESAQIARDILGHRVPIIPAGGIPISDVRDVALLHAALLEPGRGPRRYVAPAWNGHFYHVVQTVAAVTGRRLPTLVVPPALVLPPLWLTDKLQAALPFRLPASYQGAYIVARRHRVDAGPARRDFGLTARPLEETVADTVDWLRTSMRV